jgi:hypothetical protein
MLLHEQSLVLRYLGQRATASFREVLRACLPGATQEWGKRVLSDLEWLGYITVFAGGDGELLALQITDKGRQEAHHLKGMHRNPFRMPK